MNKRQPFAWWVPINGDTCFFKTYEEAKRERDSFESDFTAEDLAEGHYEPEPLYAAPAEDVRAVVEEPVGYGAWNTGTNPGTRLMRYDGMVAISPEASEFYKVPVYLRPQRPVVFPKFNEWYAKNIGVLGTASAKHDESVWNACLDKVERLNK